MDSLQVQGEAKTWDVHLNRNVEEAILKTSSFSFQIVPAELPKFFKNSHNCIILLPSFFLNQTRIILFNKMISIGNMIKWHCLGSLFSQSIRVEKFRASDSSRFIPHKNFDSLYRKLRRHSQTPRGGWWAFLMSVPPILLRK